MTTGFLLKRRSFLALAFSVGVGLVVATSPAQVQAEAIPSDLASRWVVDVPTAVSLIENGAVVLDTRDPSLKRSQPLENAQHVIWQDFTNEDAATKGRLLSDDAALTRKLQDLGISGNVPVVAVADSAQGWGEDGRIVWTLRTLGHKNAYLVDGGVAALTANGAPAIKEVTAPGDFVVDRTSEFEITKEELRSKIGSDDVVILDTREPREYTGSTPYGESRGGHVPGAKHIFYKDLVGENGHILPEDQLKAKLASLGVSEETEVVSYCTGGIRSGFVTAVLNDAGLKARNYAGSMWEWSAQSPEEYPLVVE